jgi:hypothetical protein
VTANQPERSETTGRVVNFRPRVSRRRGQADPSGARAGNPSEKTVVADLAKYEQSHGADDYRERMIINAIAFVFIVMLTAAGVWLADTIAAMRKTEDCMLSGRRNCAPIDLHALDR